MTSPTSPTACCSWHERITRSYRGTRPAYLSYAVHLSSAVHLSYEVISVRFYLEVRGREPLERQGTSPW